MKKLSILTTLALSFATAAALGQTFTGVVSDAMCAKNPAKASAPAHADCAKKCIEGGSPAVLIVGSKVYPVSNPDTLKSYAGQKVTVNGTLASGTLTVKSVKD